MRCTGQIGAQGLSFVPGLLGLVGLALLFLESGEEFPEAVVETAGTWDDWTLDFEYDDLDEILEQLQVPTPDATASTDG